MTSKSGRADLLKWIQDDFVWRHTEVHAPTVFAPERGGIVTAECRETIRTLRQPSCRRSTREMVSAHSLPSVYSALLILESCVGLNKLLERRVASLPVHEPEQRTWLSATPVYRHARERNRRDDQNGGDDVSLFHNGRIVALRCVESLPIRNRLPCTPFLNYGRAISVHPRR